MNRRTIIAAASGMALGRSAAAARTVKPRRMKPQPGDLLAHAFGDRAGVVIAPADIGVEPLSAFPKDPASGVFRNGSLHNQVAIVRVDFAPGAKTLSAETSRYAAFADDAAFVVYSQACTHTGCEVNGWQADSRRLVCPCHGSEFDIANAARVMGGPAPKPLAMLPVEATDGGFRVTGGFSRRVGPEPL